MQFVVKTIERVAPSEVSIFITGESGTGKEVVADLIHALSPCSKGTFIKINCAALPRELIESELFGSVKGAFTGAQTDRDGLFGQADGGTLLLDELARPNCSGSCRKRKSARSEAKRLTKPIVA
jgi:transcriptional regulator with PAS, ATPase and Fis domain